MNGILALLDPAISWLSSVWSDICMMASINTAAFISLLVFVFSIGAAIGFAVSKKHSNSKKEKLKQKIRALNTRHQAFLYRGFKKDSPFKAKGKFDESDVTALLNLKLIERIAGNGMFKPSLCILETDTKIVLQKDKKLQTLIKESHDKFKGKSKA